MEEKRALGINFFPPDGGRETYKQAVQGLFTAGTSNHAVTSGHKGCGKGRDEKQKRSVGKRGLKSNGFSYHHRIVS